MVDKQKRLRSLKSSELRSKESFYKGLQDIREKGEIRLKLKNVFYKTL